MSDTPSLESAIRSIAQAFDQANNEIATVWNSEDMQIVPRIKFDPLTLLSRMSDYSKLLDSLSAFCEIIEWEDVHLSENTVNHIASALCIISQSVNRVKETLSAMECGDCRIVIAMDGMMKST